MLSTRPPSQWDSAELKLLDEGFSLATARTSGLAAAAAKLAVHDERGGLLS
ncbi:MAG: hypothetical protein HQL40_13170 [Alphaproteobacteria bacterium]|nr:hypothetical protein [Alphaproteobacteria bacterium]